ncbi:hypothetical protein PINS_up007396 [Pythium insidiosum]|nr:hypothetical protein PINS_up007396 [Pythium insidiosum]
MKPSERTTRASAYAVSDKEKKSKMPHPQPRLRFVGAGKGGRVPWRQLLRLAWRLVTFIMAVLYVEVSFRAFASSITVLRGEMDASMTFVPINARLIAYYAGTSSIRASPIMALLGDTTALRSDTLYLESKSSVSFSGCSMVHDFNTRLYGNAFVRGQFEDIVEETAYTYKFLQDFELIAPVVDCSLDTILSGDVTVSRVFFLLRAKQDVNKVSLMTVSTSVQEYRLDEEYGKGSARVIVFSIVDDMRLSPVSYYHAMGLGYPYQKLVVQPYMLHGWDKEGFWVLESIPENTTEEASKVARTASRTGFYIGSDTEQSNIKNLNWDLSPDPAESMSTWPWAGRATLRDSWSWVHGIHFLFGLHTLFNIFVLLLVIYRNVQQRKIWVGDAFTSVSSTLEIRAFLVIVTTYMNEGWTLREFCLQQANELGSSQRILVHPEIIKADLLTVFMGCAGLVGRLFKERIDPAMVVILFLIGFNYRESIAPLFPLTRQYAVSVANDEYLKGMASILPKHASITPMRLWTAHPMVKMDGVFILAAVFPIIFTFAFVVAFVPARKIYRFFFPAVKIVMSRATDQSTKDQDALLSWKGTLTIFEVATGAPLQNRVGLVSDYDNCVYIKGLKYASPDGVYCNGYVIVRGKFLVATGDLFVIALMIITKVRFENVYVYEVSGFRVEHTARLVYPKTMSLHDLTHLNISILS